MRSLLKLLFAAAVVLNGAQADAQETNKPKQKTITFNCLEAPKLCKCEAFPLACLATDAQARVVRGKKVMVTVGSSALKPPTTMWVCKDLSPELCEKFGCDGCAAAK